MDKKVLHNKLKRKPKPVPLSNVKRCKTTFVNEGDSPDHHNLSVAGTASNSRSDRLEKNNFDNNLSSLDNNIPKNSIKKTGDNILNNKVDKKIGDNTCLNQHEQISSCNKVHSNLIPDSVIDKLNITSKLGDELLPTGSNLNHLKTNIVQRMTEARKDSSVKSKVINYNIDELHDRELSGSTINAGVSRKELKIDKSVTSVKETIKDNQSISHRVAEKDYELLKGSSEFEDNLRSRTRPFSRINKANLDRIKATAYDEDGNLNLKKLMMRDFIYFNPPTNPMVGNDRRSKDESDVSDYIDSSCDEETEATVASPHAKEKGSDEEIIIAAPQLKVDSNGKIVLDHKSLIIPCSTEKKLTNLKKSMIVQENELTGRYKIKKKRTDKQNSNKFDLKNPHNFSKIWTPAETLKFYKVIDDFGLDFSLMIEEFPYRTRKQLKRKFFYEEKVRCKYIDAAMKKRDSVDFEALEKELCKNQLQKEKELIIKKKEENSQQIGSDSKNSLSKLKMSAAINYIDPDIDPDGKSHRPFSECALKIKRMRACIRKLKSKYLEETGKNKSLSKNFYKCEKRIVNNNESLMFDLSIPLYRELFGKKEEVNFIDLIKCVDDFNLFIRLTSEMSQNLGKDWRNWVKEIVVNKLLNIKTDNEDERSVALEIKSVVEKQKTNEKLESCYQLFSDPFDHLDPIDCDHV